MAIIQPSMVKFETTTTGTGALSEGSAVSGFRNLTAAGMASTQQVPLRVQNSGATEWEEGLYTYTAGTPATLARSVILRSSNANAAVNFSAGTKTCSAVDLGVFHGAHDGELHSAAATTTGTALTANLFPAPFALRDFMRCTLKLDADLPGAATFNPNGLGAEPIMEMRPAGLFAVSAGRFKAGMGIRLQRIASQWQITNGMVADVVPSASDTVEGTVERSTMVEALAGSDTSRYVTPAQLAAATGKKGSNLPDGGTVTIPLTGGTYFVLDGTTALTTVALEGGNSARQPGFKVLLGFAAAKTIVHSSSLNLVDNVNLAVAAGDLLELVYEGSGVWKESDFHLETTPAPPPDPPDAVDIEVDAATSGVTLNGSMADTGLEVTVVVSDATSKVVLMATVAWEGNNDEMRFQWRRDSTDIGPDIGQAIYDNGVSNHRGVVTLMRSDAPGAGTFVYKLRARKTGSGSAVLVTQTGPSNDEAQVVGLVVVPVA